MNIDSITNGVVIDHIIAGRGMTLYELLGLDSLDCSVAIIKNVNSRKMGKKDIIKIDADIPINFDVIGYVDPGITVNVIRNEKLVEKKVAVVPGTAFQTDENAKTEYVRLNYSMPSYENIERGVQIIGDYLNGKY